MKPGAPTPPSMPWLDATQPFPIEAPAPAQPRAASTTLVLRDGPAGHLEVLLLRRHAKASFMPGHYVFPGGMVDPEDAGADVLHGCDELPAQAEARLMLPPGGIGHAIAALRETHEECGVWLGPGDDAGPAGGRWHVSALHPWAHWVTPRGMAQRFDTRFFVAVLPPGQTPQHDARETDALQWLAPAQARPSDDLPLAFVTQRMLQSLRPFRNVAEVIAAARQRPLLEVVHPRQCVDVRGARQLIDPGHFAYAEVARLDPHGAGTVRAAIVPGEPVRLAPAVWRVTAPNAGRMSGPGTNSYLLGRDGSWVVIDPGPLEDGHLDTLLQLTQGQIRAVLVTHTHPDHSPAACRLAALTGAPCVGLAPPAHGRQDRSFVPTMEPADGQVLTWSGVQLQAVHTPGHASNHVCWWLAEEALLFTGDHLMQGSTVVIDPPDGDMAVYLDSLRRLPQRLPEMAWLAPGHGFLMAHPQRAIAHLLRHRQAREDKVLVALRVGEPMPLSRLLAQVYDDVDPALITVAERSLLAHLEKLRGEGRAQCSEAGWTPL